MKEFFIKQRLKKSLRYLGKNAFDPVSLAKVAGLYVQLSQENTGVEYYQQAIEAYYQHDTRLGSDNEFILDVCRKLLDLDPLNVLAYRTLGQEYCGLCEFDEAIALYQSFAEKLSKAGQYDETIAQYRNVLVLAPESIEVRQRLAALLWRFRRKEETAEELKKIAELTEKAGNPAKALEYYKKAAKLLPFDTQLHSKLDEISQRVRQVTAPLRLVVNK